MLLPAGVVPVLVNLLSPSFSACERLEAAHALCSLACGNAEVASSIVAKGAVPLLAGLLDCAELTARHAAALCLAELVEQAPLRVSTSKYARMRLHPHSPGMHMPLQSHQLLLLNMCMGDCMAVWNGL